VFGISGPPRAIVTIASTFWVTNVVPHCSIVAGFPFPLQTTTFQPRGAAAALSWAIQTARFSEDEVLGITPMVRVPGLLVPGSLDELDELDDPPPDEAAADDEDELLLPQAPTQTAITPTINSINDSRLTFRTTFSSLPNRRLRRSPYYRDPASSYLPTDRLILEYS
jgi:hypothetical protein